MVGFGLFIDIVGSNKIIEYCQPFPLHFGLSAKRCHDWTTLLLLIVALQLQ